MRDVAQAFELCRDVVEVEQVDGDVVISRAVLLRPARQADYLPVALGHQTLDDVAADDAERTDHDGFLQHVLPRCRDDAPVIIFSISPAE